MRNIFPAVFFVTLLFISGGAQAQEVYDSSDSRIKTLNYNDSSVYTISTKFGYQTSIVFERGEEIETISVGDRSLWQIIPSGNRIFIRPMDENVITNMTVLTNKRSYQFDLKALSIEKSDLPIYVARFAYDGDIIPSQKPAPVISKPVPVAVGQIPPQMPAAPTETMNYNYTFTGSDLFAPSQVFDDGKSTFIKYRDLKDNIPRSYMIMKDGQKVPAVYYLKDNQIVIDAISGQWELQFDGGAIIIIYNEVINPK